MAYPVRSDDALEHALRSVVSDAMEQWDRVQGHTPELLYHYTDVAGVIGICSSGSLRATNLRLMNDAKELDHTWQLMLDVLARHAGSPGFDQRRWPAARLLCMRRSRTGGRKARYCAGTWRVGECHAAGRDGS